MTQHRDAAEAPMPANHTSRRGALAGLAAAAIGWRMTRGDIGAASGKSRKPSSDGLCRQDGSRCRKAGKGCRKRHCLSAPFTIAASWTEKRDHDTYVFVPPQNAGTGPAPYISFGCTPETTACEEAYPFACVDGDERETGDEITTIHRLLPGRYEYWLDLYDPSPAGAATVTIRDTTARVVRRWTSPDTTALDSSAWHVFDIDGRHGSVIAIDELAAGAMPDAAHDPFTSLCPVG